MAAAQRNMAEVQHNSAASAAAQMTAPPAPQLPVVTRRRAAAPDAAKAAPKSTSKAAPKAEAPAAAPAAAAVPAVPVDPRHVADVRQRNAARVENPRFSAEQLVEPSALRDVRAARNSSLSQIQKLEAQIDQIHSSMLGVVDEPTRAAHQKALTQLEGELGQHRQAVEKHNTLLRGHMEADAANRAAQAARRSENEAWRSAHGADPTASRTEASRAGTPAQGAAPAAPEAAAAAGGHGGGEGPGPDGRLPGSGADHNPWAHLPVLEGQDMSGAIAAARSTADAQFGGRAAQRALGGALGGAATGYAMADDDQKGRGTLAGAAAGAALGGGHGFLEGRRAQTLAARPLQALQHGVHDPVKDIASVKEHAALAASSPSSSSLHGAGAGALASGLVARGGAEPDPDPNDPRQVRTASAPDSDTTEQFMHPFMKIAAELAEREGLDQEKTAGLMSRLVTGIGLGGGLGAGAGWLYGQGNPQLSPTDRSSYTQRGAVAGALLGGAGGAFAHQLASHAANPAGAHPASTLAEKVLLTPAMGAAGSLAAGLGYSALTGGSRGVDEATEKELGKAKARDVAHSAAVSAHAPQQQMVFAKVVSSDPALAHADMHLLEESFRSMCAAAPRLATDESAVKSFLREITSFGTGPNYVTIKNLAEAEKALTHSYG